MAGVRVDFVVGGVKDTLSAFRTVAKASQDMERSVVVGMQRTDRARAQSNNNYERLQERRFAQLKREIEREQKAVQRAETFKAQVAKRAGDAAAREAEKVSKLIIRAKEREVAAVERLQEKRLTQLQRTLARELAASERADKQRLAAQKRETDRAIADRKRITSGVAGSIVGSAGGALRSMAGVAGTVTALGGGFSIADSVQTESRNQGKAADLANQSGGEISKEKVMQTASSSATQFGISTEKAIEGLDAFIAKSGDVASAMALNSRMLELSTATGADHAEMMRTAGIAHMTTGNADDTVKVMRTFAGQGRLGSVDARELAQYGGRITSAAGMYANKDEAINVLGAMTQQAAATGGATDAAEATNAVVRFGQDAFKHEDELKHLGKGVNIRDKKDKNKLRNAQDIIKDVLEQSGGDPAKLNGIFGEMSQKVIRAYSSEYNDTKGSSNDKRAAVDKQFKKFTDAPLSEAQVKADSARRLQESDKQLEMAMNQLRDAVGKELLPEFIKLIPKIREMIPAFVKLLKHVVEFGDWFLANPLKGIGAIVAGAIVRDLASAGIGAAAKGVIESILNSAAGGFRAPPTPGGAPGGGGAGAVGLLAVGAAAIETEKTQINAVLGGQTGGQRAVGELLADAKTGNGTARDAVAKRVAEAKANTGVGGTLKAAANFMTMGPDKLISMITGEESQSEKSVSKYAADREIAKNADAIAKALENAAKTIGAANTVTARPGAGAAHQTDTMSKQMGSGTQ